jgi:hypothetical protein
MKKTLINPLPQGLKFGPKIAMADFRHSVFKSPWRISATPFSNRHGRFPPNHFQTAMADFRQIIFRPPKHFYFYFQN